MDVEFEVLKGPLATKPEITRVDYDLHSLVVHIEPEYNCKPMTVTFDSPIGYRVLDEGNLLEFWNRFSLKDGWLFRITSGGWFELESRRNGFLSQHDSEIQEYFIIGVDECISVLTSKPPIVVLPRPNKKKQADA